MTFSPLPTKGQKESTLDYRNFFSKEKEEDQEERIAL